MKWLPFALFLGLGACSTGGMDNSAPPVTLSVENRTTQIARELDRELCSEGGCAVDGSSPGVVVLDGFSGTAFTAEDLQRAGDRLGLWSAADVARMRETRALDGMQRTSDGTVSWTYHPDNGLDIVIEVTAGPSLLGAAEEQV